ncbi:MAG: aminoacyl-tRNA hydrolase [Eubacteriales bacterium]
MSNLFDLFKQIETKPEGNNSAPISWIVAGLGNPGRDYAMTRHNAGFMALDLLTEKVHVSVTEGKFRSLVGRGTVGGQGVLFLKPQTLMNASGEAIRDAAQFYKISPDHILVLHDDISLDVGRIRVRRSGSAGGHNGLKSIIYQLSSDQFPRVKIGVGQKPFPEYDLAAWVLGKFPDADLQMLYEALEKAVLSVELILDGKIGDAMNKYN